MDNKDIVSLAGESAQRIPSQSRFMDLSRVGDRPEDIIQRRVQLIPALVGRDLHVRLDAGGSVRFAFQGQEYENLDELPNMTARQLIRDAIQEWEETT